MTSHVKERVVGAYEEVKRRLSNAAGGEDEAG
eukprot:CAMPEP_0118653898 /NCGR_PEP_ID=MMETSP0785-20121206/12078_1 /TAXON_ID=91992 /ORGANISM="Bolidomonas pacifica, Strain CCMP 1866" /LENGTH=31 /DNA_ID= /DNA_START= /DNA_END= /DNA_ORIENTATION=